MVLTHLETGDGRTAEVQFGRDHVILLDIGKLDDAVFNTNNLVNEGLKRCWNHERGDVVQIYETMSEAVRQADETQEYIQTVS